MQTKPGSAGPYAYQGDQWVSYDDLDMIRNKVKKNWLQTDPKLPEAPFTNDVNYLLDKKFLSGSLK